MNESLRQKKEITLWEKLAPRYDRQVMSFPDENSC